MESKFHPFQRAFIMFVLLTLVLVSIRECHIACSTMGHHEGLVYTLLLASAYLTLLYFKMFLDHEEQEAKYLWLLRGLTLTLSLIPQVMLATGVLAIAILVALEALIDIWLTIMEKGKANRKRGGPKRSSNKRSKSKPVAGKRDNMQGEGMEENSSIVDQ